MTESESYDTEGIDWSLSNQADTGCPHLLKVLLAAIHDILWRQAIYHVAGMKNNQEKDHTEEEKGLRACLFGPYLVQLSRKQYSYSVCKTNVKETSYTTKDDNEQDTI